MLLLLALRVSIIRRRLDRYDSGNSSSSGGGGSEEEEWNDAICTQCVRVLCVARRFEALRDEVRQRIVAHTLRRQPHPLSALATTPQPWARAAFARHALRHGAENDNNEGVKKRPATMHDLVARYKDWMDFDLQRTLRLYEGHLKQKARPHRDRGPYTFQLVMRERIDDPTRVKRRRVCGGEAESRRFVTLPDPRAAMQFVLDFQSVQPHTPLERQISVNECGTHDGTWRKWVLDIDASEERVRASHFSTDVDALHVAVLDLATAISNALHRRGFLASPCPFAVLSRHALPKKYSWHITLCAFAGYTQWANALRTVLEHDVRPDKQEWAMARFIDEKVIANTRSQYMQIMGSTKVVAGVPGTGRCFSDEGLYQSTMHPIPIPAAQRAALMAAATSCMLHDPWSLPFVGLANASRIDAEEKVLKRISVLVAPSSSSSAPPKKQQAPAAKKNQEEEEDAAASSSSLEALPAWMRGLVAHPSGQTILGRIPSMNDTANRPLSRLPPKHTVLLYAHVRGAACCPHALVSEGRLHRHRSDNAMLYCCSAPQPRMLMRCFSTHCAKGWVELREAHWTRLEALRPSKVQWDALPRATAAWMRPPWNDTLLVPVEEPHPPCTVTRIHVHADCTPLPFSPRRLAKEGRREPTLEGGTVVVTENRLPTVSGVSYRLWAHCPSEGWTELTRSMLCME
jgi:hypothetical protein